MKIFEATGKNWERMGNVRFAVVCKGEDGAAARERLVAIQQGLNTVNMTETFEVDDSVKAALEG